MGGSNFKTLMNELSHGSDVLRELTPTENRQLKERLIAMFQDVYAVCRKYNLTIMLGGGSALGAVRHEGFIPWDDDLDLMMPRKDYEAFKTIFEMELGEKYILSAPNYFGKSKARFPKIMKKNTTMKELTDLNSDLPSGIFLDIFVIDNIPENRIHRNIKGLWCNALMFAGSQAFWYEHRCGLLKNYMCQTKEGNRVYRDRMVLGFLCSVIPSWKWHNAIDKAIQYNGTTSLVGMPTGRKHFFGEIHSRDIMIPVCLGIFCNMRVPLPGNTDIYLQKLYGKGYMDLPPENKREKHFIVEFDLCR